MRGTPSLRARLSGLHRLDILHSHFAQIHRSHGQALLVVGFLSGFDVELLQEEGDQLGEGKRGILLLILSINPSQKFHGDELPRVDGFLEQKAGAMDCPGG